MFSDLTLGCHGPEVDNVCIIAVGDDSSLGNILVQEQLWPTGLSISRSPSAFAFPSQAMDEDKAILKVSLTDVKRVRPRLTQRQPRWVQD